MMEPALHCVAALWSPNTAIVDSHRCRVFDRFCDAWMRACASLWREGLQRMCCLCCGRLNACEVACRLMMEYQGDIESRGGSVALNSTLSRGDVSGTPTSHDIMAGQVIGPAGRQQFLQGSL